MTIKTNNNDGDLNNSRRPGIVLSKDLELEVEPNTRRTAIILTKDVELMVNMENGSSPEVIKLSKSRRYFLLFLVSIASILAPLGSTIYFPSHENIKTELQTSDFLFDASIAVFMGVLAIFPLVWGDWADRYGRKSSLVLALLLALVSFIGGGLVNNMELLVLFRILGAIGCSAPLVTGVGTLTDIFSASELGFALSLFFIGFLIGPIMGPMVGGVLDQAFGWRSTFWFMSIYCGVILILVLIFVPETLPTSAKQPYPFIITSKLRFRRTGPFFNPFRPLLFLKYPVVLMASIVYSVPFGTFFGIESFHSRAMKDIYHLSSSFAGVTFLALGAGSIVGNSVGGYISDFSFKRSLKTKPQQPPKPEVRLEGIWGCLIISIAGLLMYGWFLLYNFHLAATLFASFLVGFGYAAGSIGCSTYFVELSPQAASSITGSAIFLRMLAGGLVSGCNTLVMNNLGYGWGVTVYAGITFLSIPIVLYLTWRGERLRQRTGPPNE